jgi:hypothetical protein
MRSIRVLVLVAAMVAWPAALALPAVAAAQGSASNPLAPGFPQQTEPVPTTTATPTVSTSATAGSGGAFSGNSVIIIAIGAAVVLGGICVYIWRDARRRAPVRQRAAVAGAGRQGSKQRAKPRKLSPAERRRRKRGRAR